MRFCLDTYAKTSSQPNTLALNPQSQKSVDGAVILTDELASDNGKKYDFEATVPEGLDLTGNTFLAVVEKINDNYVVGGVGGAGDASVVLMGLGVELCCSLGQLQDRGYRVLSGGGCFWLPGSIYLSLCW